MSTSNEILSRAKEALVPKGDALTLPLAARARLLLDLCDLEDVPAAYVPTVAALWALVAQLEVSTNGAAAAKKLSETLEIACPHCPRPPSVKADATPVARNRARGLGLASWQSAQRS